MTHNRINGQLQDVMTGLVTPFGEDGAIDHDALAANARAITNAGMRVVMACANISEYHSLTHDERIAVTETSVDALPNETTVLAGAGGSTRTATKLATAFETMSVDAIMVMPPDHTFKHEEGLLEHYERIGSAVDIPLVPYLRGVDPSVQFIAALTRLDSVVAIKWALDDLPKFIESVARGSDNVVWINGLGEPHALALHTEGADGLSAGIGNFEPIIGLSLFEALKNEDREHARRIRDATLPFMKFRERSGLNSTIPHGISVPAVKAGLDFAGLSGGHVRPPLVKLSDREREQAGELYETIATFIDEEL